MSRPELVVPVADLERGPKHVEFVLSDAWLRRALEGTGGIVTAPGKLDVTLSKNGNSVLVRGQLLVDLTMPCVVTLDPVPVPVHTEVSLMLSPAGGASTEHESHALRRKPRPPRAEASGSAEKTGKIPADRPQSTGKGEGTG